MNSIANRFYTDKQAEAEGVWLLLDDGPEELLIARAGNERHEKAVEAKKDEVRKRKGIPADKDVKLEHEDVCDVMAETILLGWRNVADDPGYSPALARQMLFESRDFFYWVALRSADAANYRAATIAARAAALGNG